MIRRNSSGYVFPGNRRNQYSRRWLATPKEIGALQVMRDILNKPKPDPVVIPQRFSIGMRVKFRIAAIDNQWAIAQYHVGRVLKSWHRVTRYYLIEGEDGQRYSLPHERVLMSVDMVNIIPFEAPAMAEGKAA